MKIYGRDVGFRFTVGAQCAIAALCPGGSIQNLDKLLDGPENAVMENGHKLILALNEADEAAKSFEIPGYKPRPLTMAELGSLDLATYARLQAEAMEAMRADRQRTVEAKPQKKKKRRKRH